MIFQEQLLMTLPYELLLSNIIQMLLEKKFPLRISKKKREERLTMKSSHFLELTMVAQSLLFLHQAITRNSTFQTLTGKLSDIHKLKKQKSSLSLNSEII